MPDDHHPRPHSKPQPQPQRPPQGLPRIFDESDVVVDPALENLSNGSLTSHPETPGAAHHDSSESTDDPD